MKTRFFTQKLIFLMLMMCAGLNTWGEVTETLNCPKGTAELNTMTFDINDFTILHSKGTDANFGAYTPWRVYTNNIVEFIGGNEVDAITQIKITAESPAYATAAATGTIQAGISQSPLEDVTSTTSVAGSIVTITLSKDKKFKYLKLKPKAQTRWTSIEITYTTIITCTTPILTLPSSPTLTYNGTPQGITATSTPSALVVNYNYTGINGTTYPKSTTTPTNAGTYLVEATSAEQIIGGTTYCAVTTAQTCTLTINKATATLAFEGQPFLFPTTTVDYTFVAKTTPNNIGGAITYSSPDTDIDHWLFEETGYAYFANNPFQATITATLTNSNYIADPITADVEMISADAPIISVVTSPTFNTYYKGYNNPITQTQNLILSAANLTAPATVTATSVNGAVSVNPTTIDNGDNIAIVVSVDESKLTQKEDATITLSGGGLVSNIVLTIPLDVKIPSLITTPEELDFGNQATTLTKQMTATVTLKDFPANAVINLSSSNSEFVATLNQNALSVNFTPLSDGLRTSILTFSSENFSQPMTVKGNGYYIPTAPKLQAATHITNKGFTIHWDQMVGATEYEVKVTNTIKSIIAEHLTFPALPSGWKTTNGTYSGGEINFASTSGDITTKAFSHPFQLQFDLRRSSNSSQKTLNIYISTTSQTTGFTLEASYTHNNTVSSGTTNVIVDLSNYSSYNNVWIKLEKASSTTSPWYIKNFVLKDLTETEVTTINNITTLSHSVLFPADHTSSGDYIVSIKAKNPWAISGESTQIISYKSEKPQQAENNKPITVGPESKGEIKAETVDIVVPSATVAQGGSIEVAPGTGKKATIKNLKLESDINGTTAPVLSITGSGEVIIEELHIDINSNNPPSLTNTTANVTVQKIYAYINDAPNGKWAPIAFPYGVSDIEMLVGKDWTPAVVGTNIILRYYDGQERANSGSGGWKNHLSKQLEANVGYLIVSDNPDLRFVFDGTNNNIFNNINTIAVNEHQGTDGRKNNFGWNFLGSPKAIATAPDGGKEMSHISIDGTGKAVYTTVKEGTQIGSVKQFQPFFVQVGAGDATFPIKAAAMAKAMYVDAGILLHLELTNSRQISGRNYIEVKENESQEFVLGNDLAMMWNDKGAAIPEVATIASGYSVAVNKLDFAQSIEIPLVLKGTGGEHSLSVGNIEALRGSAYLIDASNGSIIKEITNEPALLYLDNGTENRSYALRIQKVATGCSNLLQEGVLVYAKDQKIFLSGLSESTQVEVIDISGKILVQTMVHSSSAELSVNYTGMAVIRVIQSNVVQSIKINIQ